MNESSGGWWQTAGNFLRLSFRVGDTSKTINGYPGYCGLFPLSVPQFPTNAPKQLMTAGFDYRIVSVSGNVLARVGVEFESNFLDLTKTSWTSVSATSNSPQKSILWVHLLEPTATLTIDLRNIYLNLGEANFYTLGIPQLTDLNI
jgi:hypothetical protein